MVKTKKQIPASRVDFSQFHPLEIRDMVNTVERTSSIIDELREKLRRQGKWPAKEGD